MTDSPHFLFPFQLGPDGHVAEVEQDSIDDVAGCVQAILLTPRGHRDDLPEFGTVDPAFLSPPDTEGQREAITEWEPRAEATLIDDSDAYELGVQRVRAIVEGSSVHG